MLLFSRKKNEMLVIGNPDDGGATIVVMDIREDKVRLGIEAPAHVTVHRQEVYDAVYPHTQKSRQRPQDRSP